MQELRRLLPDAEQLLGLEPEELAGVILFALRERRPDQLNNGGMFHPSNLRGEVQSSAGVQAAYPPNLAAKVEHALIEAWAWLEAQGLIVAASGSNGLNGWRVLSRRASRFETRTDFARFHAASRLPRDLLHPSIAHTVWMAFMRGEYDVAAFQAMKAVEVSVREASGLVDQLGVKLMRTAFHPDTGPLTDPTAESGERFGRSELFSGAMGSYKNPHSHRNVELNDPAEALEIIMLANHLLRIVDHRASARAV